MQIYCTIWGNRKILKSLGGSWLLKPCERKREEGKLLPEKRIISRWLGAQKYEPGYFRVQHEGLHLKKKKKKEKKKASIRFEENK